MPGLLYIKTFGCQMNEYDSGKMRDVLEAEHGMRSTDNPAEADVLLVNTCSVREKAAEKVFSLLGKWRELKLARPELLIGVGGCVASQEGEALTESSVVGAFVNAKSATADAAPADVSFPAAGGAGSALRSTLPLGVNGSAASTTKAAGTIASGRPRRRCSLSDATASASAVASAPATGTT